MFPGALKFLIWENSNFLTAPSCETWFSSHPHPHTVLIGLICSLISWKLSAAIKFQSQESFLAFKCTAKKSFSFIYPLLCEMFTLFDPACSSFPLLLSDHNSRQHFVSYRKLPLINPDWIIYVARQSTNSINLKASCRVARARPSFGPNSTAIAQITLCFFSTVRWLDRLVSILCKVRLLL
jgi:hypothetical protein